MAAARNEGDKCPDALISTVMEPNTCVFFSLVCSPHGCLQLNRSRRGGKEKKGKEKDKEEGKEEEGKEEEREGGGKGRNLEDRKG